MSIHCVDPGWQPWSTPLSPGLGGQFRNRCEAWGPVPQGTEGLQSLARLHLSCSCFGECSLVDQVPHCPHIFSLLLHVQYSLDSCCRHRKSPW